MLTRRRKRHQPDPEPHRIDREHHQLPLRQAQPPNRSQDDRRQQIALSLQTRRRRQPHQPTGQHHRRNRRHNNQLRPEQRQRAGMPPDRHRRLLQKRHHRTLRLHLRRRRGDRDHWLQRSSEHKLRLQQRQPAHRPYPAVVRRFDPGLSGGRPERPEGPRYDDASDQHTGCNEADD